MSWFFGHLFFMKVVRAPVCCGHHFGLCVHLSVCQEVVLGIANRLGLQRLLYRVLKTWHSIDTYLTGTAGLVE